MTELMRKSIAHLTIGIAATAVVIGAGIAIILCRRPYDVEHILAIYDSDAEYGALEICYPLDETIFPPEIVPPTFTWEDADADSEAWLVTVGFRNGKDGIETLTRECKWKPEDQQWEVMKK